MGNDRLHVATPANTPTIDDGLQRLPQPRILNGEGLEGVSGLSERCCRDAVNLCDFEQTTRQRRKVRARGSAIMMCPRFQMGLLTCALDNTQHPVKIAPTGPQGLRYSASVYSPLGKPALFIAGVVQRSVARGIERYRPFIGRLAAQPPAFGTQQMMGVHESG